MNARNARSEHLFRAIGDVGGDLIDLAERKTFAPGYGRKLLQIAACLVVLIGLGAGVRSMLRTASGDEAQLQATVPAASEPETPAGVGYQWSESAEASKERLVVNGTIYYAEAVYAAESAKPGDWIGVVDGANVYAGGETWKPDKWGREMPLEIFVEYGEDYRYCLTYYAWDGPAYTMEEARSLEDLTVFAAGAAFADPAELTEEQLVAFFLHTLELERQAGRRTEDLNRYLWYDETQQSYVIPMEDIAMQLDRYLDGNTWPRLAENRALMLQTLETAQQPEVFVAAVFEEQSLILTTDRSVYTIRFAENRCVYESIQERQ